jgi:hypothetical protein
MFIVKFSGPKFNCDPVTSFVDWTCWLTDMPLFYYIFGKSTCKYLDHERWFPTVTELAVWRHIAIMKMLCKRCILIFYLNIVFVVEVYIYIIVIMYRELSLKRTMGNMLNQQLMPWVSSMKVWGALRHHREGSRHLIVGQPPRFQGQKNITSVIRYFVPVEKLSLVVSFYYSRDRTLFVSF